MKTQLSAYYVEGQRRDVTATDMSTGLKMAATALAYPETRGIPIDRVDTHSLRSGGANALALSGYSDTQIMKFGRWRGATFREYIHEELATYAKGVSKDMKTNFKFVNVAGGAYSDIVDITGTVVAMDYGNNAAAA